MQEGVKWWAIGGRRHMHATQVGLGLWDKEWCWWECCMGESPCKDACWALDECFCHPKMVRCLTPISACFYFVEGRGRQNICEVNNFCRWVVHDATIDLNIFGIINSRGCIYCRELVEWGELKVAHAAGWWVGRRWGCKMATGDRKHILRGTYESTYP